LIHDRAPRSFRWALPLAVLLCAPWAMAEGLNAADRQELKKALQEVLDHPSMSAARVGVVVHSLEDGKPLFAENADELLNPASNMKLVTAAATLARLGPEYRFSTEFLTDAEVGADGRVKVLYVRGKGDPTLTSERLFLISTQLFHAGVRHVDQIVVDDSWFGDGPYPPGYEQDTGDYAYLAPTGALSLNWNTVAVYLRPGSAPGATAIAEVEPKSEYLVTEGSLRTGKRRQHRWRVKSEPLSNGRQKLLLSGTVGRPDVVRRRVGHPELYFGHTLAEYLRDRGVKVRKSAVKRGTVPESAKILHVAWSDTFDIVLKVMNKYSQNFVAEQLLKTLGAEIKGAPGTTAKGVEVVEEFLAREVGIPRGTYVMRNGSGLNDTNRMSATQITRILVHMQKQFAMASEFVSSVPIAGKDGTLRNRFSGSVAESTLRAKTGTLENVSALAGYVEAQSGRRYAFTFLVNDFDWRRGGRRAVVGGMDTLGVTVAASGGTAASQKAVARNVSPEAQSLNRLKTYLALGHQRDARNVPFLRTALRSETDPAVRAILAEALYQSTPEETDLAHAFLEAYSPDPAVFGRLVKVAQGEASSIPGLQSVMELAARGSEDALRLLLSLAQVRDADMGGEFSQGLADVSRTAPEELLSALAPLSAAERANVTRMLARGLGTHNPTHPLWATLERSASGTDKKRASLARATESALATHLVGMQALSTQQANRESESRAETRPGG
jgi:D-alanyl-D-alanine carboxypeptidase/D-alanyl-D-alanine-endopeptidase (penicillin-binding protein 4)